MARPAPVGSGAGHHDRAEDGEGGDHPANADAPDGQRGGADSTGAGGWPDFAHTTSLVATLAFLPLSLCAVVAARVLAVRARLGRSTTPAAIAVLVVCVSWLGYVTVPYVLSWGPVLLVLVACCTALALSGRARTGSAPAP